MKNKKVVIGSLVTILTLGAGLSSVYAFQVGHFGFDKENKNKIKEAIENNDYEAWRSLMENRISEENFIEMRERHQNMEGTKEAIENNDYDAFVEAVKGSPMEERLGDKVTKDNFDKFVEMHNLREDGKYDEARVVGNELGLERLGGLGMRHGVGRHMSKGLK